MKSIIVVFVVASLSAVLGADYCLNTLCSAGVTHIACGHNGQFASTCPAGAHLIDITPHINNILSSHNIKRNTIAGGNLAGYLPAVRMAQMQWNTELAYLASLNVKQCIMKHDSCRNTATFKTSGQNLGSMGYSGVESRLNDSYIILDRIDAWWNEFTVANMNYINSYPSNYNGPAIGHFTVMTAQSNTHVGCAAARYYDGWNRFLFACNYATTNIIGRAMYVSGTTASQCKTGRSSVYPNLCSTNETY